MGKKKHEDHEEHMDETWLIPYADLLTLLLALFIVLFAVSQTDYKKREDMAAKMKIIFSGGTGVMDKPAAMTPKNPDPQGKKNKSAMSKEEKMEAAKKEKKEMQQVQKELQQMFKEKGIESQVQMRLENNQLRIIINDNALFNSGSAQIKPEALSLGLNIAEILAKSSDHKVSVTGHTDTIPIHNDYYESNWDLSSQRAVNFMKLLLHDQRLDPHNFSSSGFGEFQPLTSNATEEGRSRNRRVEVSMQREFEEVETRQYWDENAARDKIISEDKKAIENKTPQETTPEKPVE